MTVVRLIAAADFSGKPSPRFKKGTSRIPPPRPSAMPRPPATAPAAKMMSASDPVIGGTPPLALVSLNVVERERFERRVGQAERRGFGAGAFNVPFVHLHALDHP